MKYFSYDPLYEGFEFHKTEEEAKNAVQEAFDKYMEEDAWSNYIEDVCWGEIKQIATQTTTCPHDDCTSQIHPNCSNYVLKTLS